MFTAGVHRDSPKPQVPPLLLRPHAPARNAAHPLYSHSLLPAAPVDLSCQALSGKEAELGELRSKYGALTRQYDEAVHKANLAKQVGQRAVQSCAVSQWERQGGRHFKRLSCPSAPTFCPPAGPGASPG